MTTLLEAFVQVSADLSSFNRDIDRSQGSISSKLGALGRTAGGAFATAFKAAAVAGVAALAGGALLGRKFVGMAMESQEASAKLETVLKATGGAARLTADDMKSLASELQKTTVFEDDAIVGAESLIATFKNIKGDVFKDAVRGVLDMSTVLGTDLKGSAVQLGKALNDPLKGITALSRAGIQFTAAQKEQIKSLVEAGKMAAAQRIILDELAGQMGGAAVAKGKTFAGQLAILSNRLGDVGEEIGFALIPSLTALQSPFAELVGWLESSVPTIHRWGAALASLTSQGIDRAKALGAAFLPDLSAMATQVASFTRDAFGGAAIDLGGLIGVASWSDALATAKSAFTSFVAGVKGVGQAIAAALQNPIVKTIGKYAALATIVGGGLAAAFATVTTAAGYLAPIVAGAGAAIASVFTPLGLTIAGVGAAVAALGIAFKNALNQRV